MNNILRQVYFYVENWVRFIFTSCIRIGVTVWNCATRDQRHSSGEGLPPSFPPSRFAPSFLPVSLASPRLPSLPLSRRSFWSKQTRYLIGCPVCGVWCYPSLASSISNGVTGRARSAENCLSTLFSSGICWMNHILLLCYERY